jgi:hypothetical protein
MAELEGPERRRRRTGFRLTARYQVTGWRFLFRRLQHALVRRDTRMIDDPQRAQAGPLLLGLVLAVVVCLGAVVWGLFSPGGLVKDAKIVANKDSGALYVRVGDRLDPVTNLTSARLIVGSPDKPVRASAAEIDALLASKLAAGWTLARLDKAMLQVLRAGTYELLARQDVPVADAISDYVDVAKAFFDDGQAKFVNGVLDAVAKEARAG